MLNQRTSFPFGDAHIISTPKTDRFVAQERERNFQDIRRKEEEVNDLDKQISSQLGNILNQDIGELTQSWQQYKQAKKQLLFDKKLQSDPEAYAQKQIEVNQKLGNAMQIVGDSAKRKQLLAAQLADYNKNPHKYEDDFYDRYKASLSLPTSKARLNPNVDNFVWNGPDMDFSKTLKDAAGNPRQLRENSVVKGETTEYTPIIGTNDPITFKSKLDARNLDRKYQVTARKILQNMSQAEIDNINYQYANLPKDKFENWGMDAPPNLEPQNPDDPAEVYNSILAKKHAIAASFQQGKTRSVVDAAKRRELNMQDFATKVGIRYEDWKKKEAIRQQNRVINQENGKSDDEAFFWVSVGPEILRTGTPEQKQAYLANLGTGGGKAKFVSANVDGKPAITYTVKKKIPGLGDIDEKVTKVFDPSDPNLQIELVEAYNELKGKNVKLTRRTYNKEAITGGGSVQQTPQPAKKEIKRADIKSKAEAAGYSIKEYEQLLKQKGITITD